MWTSAAYRTFRLDIQGGLKMCLSVQHMSWSKRVSLYSRSTAQNLWQVNRNTCWRKRTCSASDRVLFRESPREPTHSYVQRVNGLHNGISPTPMFRNSKPVGNRWQISHSNRQFLATSSSGWHCRTRTYSLTCGCTRS